MVSPVSQKKRCHSTHPCWHPSLIVWILVQETVRNAFMETNTTHTQNRNTRSRMGRFAQTQKRGSYSVHNFCVPHEIAFALFHNFEKHATHIISYLFHIICFIPGEALCETSEYIRPLRVWDRLRNDLGKPSQEQSLLRARRGKFKNPRSLILRNSKIDVYSDFGAPWSPQHQDDGLVQESRNHGNEGFSYKQIKKLLVQNGAK